MRLLCVALLLIICGCSTKTIHLYNQGYSEDEISHLKDSLVQQGYTVERPDVRVPNEFPNVVIALNPAFSDQDFYRYINQQLIDKGFGTATEFRFAQGQHFYSKNDVGIYLKNPNQLEQPMPPYLRTQYCKTSSGATILFNDNNKFVLEYENNHYDEVLIKLNGEYSFDGTMLTLFPADMAKHAYRLHKEVRETPYGDRPADVFKPIANNSPLGEFNCEFLIIYI